MLLVSGTGSALLCNVNDKHPIQRHLVGGFWKVCCADMVPAWLVECQLVFLVSHVREGCLLM